jgi:nicotinamidase-related amidase
MLLIDQPGELFEDRDMPMQTWRAKLGTRAKAATLARMPVIATVSAPPGCNAPLIPEIRRCAPHATYVVSHGEINVWDNPNMVTAVRATRKWQLIVAGTAASVCVALPAVAAVDDGYQVFAVVGARARGSTLAQAITLARITQSAAAASHVTVDNATNRCSFDQQIKRSRSQ